MSSLGYHPLLISLANTAEPLFVVLGRASSLKICSPSAAQFFGLSDLLMGQKRTDPATDTRSGLNQAGNSYRPGVCSKR